jgi:hypothetical protein
VTYERAKQVKDRRGEEIYSRFEGVQGFGLSKVVGRLTDRTRPSDPVWGIVVFIDGRPPAGSHSIDGVPLKFTVTGKFRPLGA